MRERTALLGGECNIYSRPGTGTLVSAEIPVPELAADESQEAPATPSEPARIAIVDDHDLVRVGLRTMLIREPGLAVVGEARNGREAIDLCRRERPDLVLMDVRMPDMDGLEATSLIKQQCPETAVVMVTMHDSPDYLLEALKVGAAGYVLKGSSRSEVVAAVRQVLRGESPLGGKLVVELLRRLAAEGEGAGSVQAISEPLTRRELEVLGLLAEGKTNREIAQSLVVSPSTAKNHVQHIIAKLGVSDRTQAAVRAIELGLISSRADR